MHCTPGKPYTVTIPLGPITDNCLKATIDPLTSDDTATGLASAASPIALQPILKTSVHGLDHG